MTGGNIGVRVVVELNAAGALDWSRAVIDSSHVREKGITPVIARRGTEHGSGLGTYRWVIEQSIALLHWFRRLRIRWEIRDDIHEAFLSIGCAIICWRRLKIHALC